MSFLDDDARLAAQLRAEISATQDARQRVSEEARKSEAASASALAEAARREQMAVAFASQRVDALARARTVAAAGAGNGGSPRKAGAGAGGAGGAPPLSQLRAELAVLRDEEEVRARRMAGLEASIREVQERIAGQAAAYEDVLRKIEDVRATFTTREVRRRRGG
jgi:hypothetical protein